MNSLHEQLQVLKDKYLVDLNDVLKMLVEQPMPPNQFQKMNHYKAVLSRMISYLAASRTNIPKEFTQDKLEAFENQIVSILETFRLWKHRQQQKLQQQQQTSSRMSTLQHPQSVAAQNVQQPQQLLNNAQQRAQPLQQLKNNARVSQSSAMTSLEQSVGRGVGLGPIQSNSVNALHGSLQQNSLGSLHQQQALKQQQQQQQMLKHQDQQLVQQKLQIPMQMQQQLQVQDHSKLDTKRPFHEQQSQKCMDQTMFSPQVSQALSPLQPDQQSFTATALPIPNSMPSMLSAENKIAPSAVSSTASTPLHPCQSSVATPVIATPDPFDDACERLLRIVDSMSSKALSSAVAEMKSVISLASAPGPGCRPQARALVSQEGGAVKKFNKRHLHSIPLSVISSDGSVADSLCKGEEDDLEFSRLKTQRTETWVTLLH